MTPTPFELDRYLNGLTLEQLEQLNQRIVNHINLRHDLQQARSHQKFKCGDQVSFTYKGRHYVGVVIKKNPKTISVSSDGRHWNISPNLLNIVNPAH